MPSTQIQWFPGHMAKTKRLIEENLSSVDIVLEIRDARIPYSSKNPDIRSICRRKPILTIFAKADLSDPSENRKWIDLYKSKNQYCAFVDCKNSSSLNIISSAVFDALQEKSEKYREKGLIGKTMKAMVVGIPNVGKSTLINKMAGTKKAKAEDRPGVTTAKQWIKTSIGIDLLDTPGVLWPKFDDERVGEKLAATKAIKDDILDIERIATSLLSILREAYPDLLSERYKLNSMSEYENLEDYELMEVIGRKRGFLVSGGEIDYERTSKMLLSEFRSGQIGKITLEKASDYNEL